MTTAREIMHEGAQCVGESESLLSAARMMRDLGVGALPICGEDDRLKGIITDRDIVIKCIAEGKNPADAMAGELAQGAPQCVNANDDAEKVVQMMERRQIRRVPVLENKRLVGMISEADLARSLPEDKLAEFVESVYASR
ncbi:CBS domain-containing protein [Actinomadura craniellae]|uniref:CBS domain-containing protein n=1 Tax=Actinomadura craniellae TaxID=2231787 RepID=A0A365HCV2_9ACTN|nr:CBS domain-containing protein [Actinomadura craniellae]RAY16093.1 CBS domain-containing protein [Actinomadura craniellae]